MADALVTAAGVVPVTLAGVLLAARQPRNPIGWTLLAIILLDAEAIMAASGARLRRTAGLDTVQGDLAGVVDKAFQPAHVTVWLPANGQRGSGVDTRLAKRQPAGVRTTSSE